MNANSSSNEQLCSLLSIVSKEVHHLKRLGLTLQILPLKQPLQFYTQNEGFESIMGGESRMKSTHLVLRS